MKFSKRSAFGVTALGAVAAGAASIVAAPSADAFVINAGITAGPYCTGHTYQVKVNVDLTSDLIPVSFKDNGTELALKAPGFLATSITFNWTPTTVGNHTLVVGQDFIPTTIGTVTVGSCTTTTTTTAAPTTTTTAAPTTTTTAPGATTTTGAGVTTTTPSSDTGSASGILGGILSGLSSALPSGSAA